MDYIVDLQGFKKPINEFVLKEISIIEVGSDKIEEPLTLLFESSVSWNSLPVKYKATNLWLERNFHGISWNSGNIPCEAAKNIIQTVLQDARIIYVKGLEKKCWLTNFTDESVNIIDMETLDCPSLKKLLKISPNARCSYHSNILNCNCASVNVKILKSWLNVYQD